MSSKSTTGKLGTLLLTVVETRDFKSAYCTVSCDVVNRIGVAKKKNEANAKYDESFTLFATPTTTDCHLFCNHVHSQTQTNTVR